MKRLFTVRKNDLGFTLAEVLVVCAVVGLLLGIAVPGFVASLDSLRVKNATSVLAADIRLAQVYAQKQGARARLIFSPDLNAYSVQVGSRTASEDCASTEYQVVKSESLDPTITFTNATFSCLVFEPTGRTAWTNPKVFRPLTTSPDGPSGAPFWINFLNGVEVPWTTVASDTNLIYWVDPTGGKVDLVVDLGSYKQRDWVCPQVIRDAWDEIALPEWVEIYRSDKAAATPPGPDEWIHVVTKTLPYDGEAVQAPTGDDWWRACPRITDSTTRWVRFILKAGQFAPGYPRVMLLDEIKVSDPSVVVSTLNGKKSRKLTIAPITGRVTIH